jgi:crossover junction endodeoxyribonuclease RusA
MDGCPNCGWEPAQPRRWAIELLDHKPMTLNHRMHHMVKAKLTAGVRASAAEVVELAGVPPMERIRTWIEYAPKDKRRRDPINLIPMLKACEDAIVDLGIVPDDTSEFVESVMPKILPKSDEGRGFLWLVIEEA